MHFIDVEQSEFKYLYKFSVKIQCNVMTFRFIKYEVLYIFCSAFSLSTSSVICEFDF